jgi:hypothetical protein
MSPKTTLDFTHLVLAITFKAPGQLPWLDCGCGLRLAGTSDADLAAGFSVHVRAARHAAGNKRGSAYPNHATPDLPGLYQIPFGRATQDDFAEERMSDARVDDGHQNPPLRVRSAG